MNTKNSLQNKLARSYKIFLHNLCKIIPDPARRFLYRGLLALHYCFYSNRMGIIVHVHWQEIVGSVSYTTGNCKMMHHFLCLLITVRTNQVGEYIKTLMNGVSALPTLHPWRRSVINWLQCIIHLHHILLCSDPEWFHDNHALFFVYPLVVYHCLHVWHVSLTCYLGYGGLMCYLGYGGLTCYLGYRGINYHFLSIAASFVV